MTVHEAAKAGDLEWLHSLLETFPDRLQMRDKDGWSPLHWAAAANQIGAADYLISKGAQVDCRDQDDFATPLCWAAYHGQLEMVEYLLSKGADPMTKADLHGFGPLGFATVHVFRPHVANRLLAAGARHSIFSAVGAGDIEAVRKCALASPRSLRERLTKYDECKGPLHLAASLGRLEVAEALIALGASPGNPNEDAESPGSPFAYALRCQEDDRLAVLLLPEGPSQDLYRVMAEGRQDQLQAVLQMNPGLVGRQGIAYWALQAATIRNWLPLMHPLVEAGADPNQLWFGCSSLHRAAFLGNRPACEELIRLGARRELRDEHHDSDAVAWAYQAGHRDLAMLLKGPLPMQP